jgi:hypothetical protein
MMMMMMIDFCDRMLWLWDLVRAERACTDNAAADTQTLFNRHPRSCLVLLSDSIRLAGHDSGSAIKVFDQDHIALVA